MSLAKPCNMTEYLSKSWSHLKKYDKLLPRILIHKVHIYFIYKNTHTPVLMNKYVYM